jgi:hypothetical protein
MLKENPMRTWLLVLSLLAAAHWSCSAAMTLEDLTPGKTLCGPDSSLKDMRGKVVYVEFWGTR